MAQDQWWMAPCAAIGGMQGVELQLCFCQDLENPPLVTEQGRQNWDLFLVCGDLPFFSSVFLGFFFFLKSKASTAAAHSASRAGPGSSRASTGQWSRQDIGGAGLPLESCWCGTGDQDSGTWWAALICLWSIPSFTKSSAAACHLRGTEMFLQWPFLFNFFLPALSLWKLLHPVNLGVC